MQNMADNGEKREEEEMNKKKKLGGIRTMPFIFGMYIYIPSIDLFFIFLSILGVQCTINPTHRALLSSVQV